MTIDTDITYVLYVCYKKKSVWILRTYVGFKKRGHSLNLFNTVRRHGSRNISKYALFQIRQTSYGAFTNAMSS